MVRNNQKWLVATIVGGLVGGGLAYAQGLPGDRVIISAVLGAVVVFALLLGLKFRP